MNKQQQNEAIAKACGLDVLQQDRDTIWCDSTTKFIGSWQTEPERWHGMLPKYTADLNAMHEAEKTLPSGERADFVRALYNIVPNCYIGTYSEWLEFEDYWELAHATAAERAEAFLRTKGLWVK